MLTDLIRSENYLNEDRDWRQSSWNADPVCLYYEDKHVQI